MTPEGMVITPEHRAVFPTGEIIDPSGNITNGNPLKPLISQRIDGEIVTSNGVILTPGSQITAASGMILTMQSNGSFVDGAGNSFIMTHEGKLLDSAGNQSTVTSQVIETEDGKLFGGL